MIAKHSVAIAAITIVFAGWLIWPNVAKNINTIFAIPEPTLEDDLDRWLSILTQPGNEACDPEGTHDMGSLSYGALCFKEDTFRRYVARYNLLPYAEGDEVMNWIGDSRFQHKLAKKMIQEDWKNWRHWKNTVINKIGYPPK